jgi:hypothetical protein
LRTIDPTCLHVGVPFKRKGFQAFLWLHARRRRGGFLRSRDARCQHRRDQSHPTGEPHPYRCLPALESATLMAPFDPYAFKIRYHLF